MSSNEGHNLGHIWSKSPVWQSPPMRNTIWATFSWSPLCDKVLRWGAQFGPHLVKVCSETKSSDEEPFFCHIWPLSAAWQLCLMANHGYHSLATFDQSPLCDTSSNKGHCFPFYAEFGQCQLIDMQLSSVMVQIFLNAYSISVTANTTYMASFPKRPDITGAPDQVFEFNNFLDHLIGDIKANTISAIGTTNPDLYAPNTFMPPRSISTWPAILLPSLETCPTIWASPVWSR